MNAGRLVSRILFRAPVHKIAFDIRELYVFKTTHVDGSHLCAICRSKSKGRATTGLAEVMLDDVFVEGVCRKLRCGRRQRKLRTWHEPEQVTFPAAMGAVTFHY